MESLKIINDTKEDEKLLKEALDIEANFVFFTEYLNNKEEEKGIAQMVENMKNHPKTKELWKDEIMFGFFIKKLDKTDKEHEYKETNKYKEFIDGYKFKVKLTGNKIKEFSDTIEGSKFTKLIIFYKGERIGSKQKEEEEDSFDVVVHLDW